MADIIPIDEQIATFSDYLDNNCRGILSARFGDGKSFFLNKVKEKLSDRYTFITIYPINYQVADNKDIFEYIKRDILLQILMSSEIDLTDEKYGFLLRLWLFCNKNKDGIATDIISLLALTQTCIPGAAIDMLKKNIAKFRDLSDPMKSKSDKIETYIDEFAQSIGSIYEFDPISQIICRLITDMKTLSGKRVVLVIEDMDRIDPAHIFRILNVFSAHWDIRDYSPAKLENGDPLNKYNFDKILLVCHFRNIKNIFHHFYGAKTDFTGYIHKFSSSTPYEYSLRDVIEEWILNKIPFDQVLYPDICRNLTNFIMQKYGDSENIITNIRHITEFLNRPQYHIIKNRFPPEEFINYNYFIDTENQLTRLLYILKDFQISVDEFLDSFVLTGDKRNDSHHRQICHLIGQCWIMSTWIFENQAIKLSLYDNNRILCEYQQKQYLIRCKTTKVTVSVDGIYRENYKIDYMSIEEIFNYPLFTDFFFSKQNYAKIFSFFINNYLY